MWLYIFQANHHSLGPHRCHLRASLAFLLSFECALEKAMPMPSPAFLPLLLQLLMRLLHLSHTRAAWHPQEGHLRAATAAHVEGPRRPQVFPHSICECYLYLLLSLLALPFYVRIMLVPFASSVLRLDRRWLSCLWAANQSPRPQTSCRSYIRFADATPLMLVLETC